MLPWIIGIVGLILIVIIWWASFRLAMKNPNLSEDPIHIQDGG